ncbi:hypothetical protein SNEBB_008519 [Seison nebaliae]|nr:hypothetical protein SNEBB_008519 [Seison nebaliae]
MEERHSTHASSDVPKAEFESFKSFRLKRKNNQDNGVLPISYAGESFAQLIDLKIKMSQQLKDIQTRLYDSPPFGSNERLTKQFRNSLAPLFLTPSITPEFVIPPTLKTLQDRISLRFPNHYQPRYAFRDEEKNDIKIDVSKILTDEKEEMKNEEIEGNQLKITSFVRSIGRMIGSRIGSHRASEVETRDVIALNTENGKPINFPTIHVTEWKNKNKNDDNMDESRSMIMSSNGDNLMDQLNVKKKFYSLLDVSTHLYQLTYSGNRDRCETTKEFRQTSRCSLCEHTGIGQTIKKSIKRNRPLFKFLITPQLQILDKPILFKCFKNDSSLNQISSLISIELDIGIELKCINFDSFVATQHFDCFKKSCFVRLLQCRHSILSELIPKLLVITFERKCVPHKKGRLERQIFALPNAQDYCTQKFLIDNENYLFSNDLMARFDLITEDTIKFSKILVELVFFKELKQTKVNTSNCSDSEKNKFGGSPFSIYDMEKEKSFFSEMHHHRQCTSYGQFDKTYQNYIRRLEDILENNLIVASTTVPLMENKEYGSTIQLTKSNRHMFITKNSEIRFLSIKNTSLELMREHSISNNKRFTDSTTCTIRLCRFNTFIKITKIYISNLKKHLIYGKPDTFLLIQIYHNRKFRNEFQTSICMETSSPQWRDDILIPIQSFVHTKIVVKLYDCTVTNILWKKSDSIDASILRRIRRKQINLNDAQKLYNFGRIIKEKTALFLGQINIGKSVLSNLSPCKADNNILELTKILRN